MTPVSEACPVFDPEAQTRRERVEGYAEDPGRVAQENPGLRSTLRQAQDRPQTPASRAYPKRELHPARDGYRLLPRFFQGNQRREHVNAGEEMEGNWTALS